MSLNSMNAVKKDFFHSTGAFVRICLLAALFILPFSALAVPASEDFNNPANPTATDATLAQGDWTLGFINNGIASDQGFFSINDDGVSGDLGADPDFYLIAMGTLNATDGISITPTTDPDPFQLDSLNIAKGLFGETALTVQGVSSGGVVASMDVTVTSDNLSQLVSFSGNQWNSLDAIRIVNASGNDDFDIELDDLAVSAPATGVSPNLSINPLAAVNAEGNSGTTAFTFTVIRSGNVAGASSASYAVSGTGANPADAADFGGSLPSGTVSFAATETSQVITINVSGDTLAESDEAFTVTLSSPSNATLGITSAEGTIQNDDTTLAIAATSAVNAEGDAGNTAFTFTVTRSGDTTGASSAAYDVTGTGTNPADAADFGGALPSGTVSFAATETSQVVTVNVSGDTLPEQDETFQVALSAPTGATLGTSTAAGTIQNDDVPNITNVTIPNVPMQVNDVVNVTITVDDDGGDVYTNLSGTIGGFALSNLARSNSTTYTATFTVTEGGTNVAAGSDIPVSVRLQSSTLVDSNLYNTPISQGSDPIVARTPGAAIGVPVLNPMLIGLLTGLLGLFGVRRINSHKE
ncbi:MAG: hypothetical protein C0631_06850 [Sedimenticola sp.]|nr:MAG: hypothetical protein C0631_06850 [Sedimenticola sp.]